VDDAGHVYVVDSDNARVQKFTSSGVFVTKWGRKGSGHGQFYDPLAVAVDGSGYVYVSDGGNGRVQKFGPVRALVKQDYSLNVGGQNFTLTALTNSSISDIDTSDIASTRNMSFVLECSWGISVCNLTIPNAMLGGPYVLMIGGEPPLSSTANVVNLTHTSLYFTHNGTGKYLVQITGATAVPEFSLRISLGSPATIFITDPLGRSFGFDSRTGLNLTQIPDTSYFGNSPRTVVIENPINGTYNIQIYTTATGSYALSIELSTPSGNSVKNYTGQISTGETQIHVADVVGNTLLLCQLESFPWTLYTGLTALVFTAGIILLMIYKQRSQRSFQISGDESETVVY
jgi:hypothetical protein